MQLYLSTFDSAIKGGSWGISSEIKIETNITFFILKKIKYQINFEKKMNTNCFCWSKDDRIQL